MLDVTGELTRHLRALFIWLLHLNAFPLSIISKTSQPLFFAKNLLFLSSFFSNYIIVRGNPISLITSMIIDWIELHSVLLPLLSTTR